MITALALLLFAALFVYTVCRFQNCRQEDRDFYGLGLVVIPLLAVEAVICVNCNIR